MNITLPLPPSANRIWRMYRNIVVLSKEAREYKELAYWKAKEQGAKPIEGPVIMSGVFYFPNKRGDLSNRIKILEDAMEGACYLDDKQIQGIQWSKEIDKGNPRVEFSVHAVMEANDDD